MTIWSVAAEKFHKLTTSSVMTELLELFLGNFARSLNVAQYREYQVEIVLENEQIKILCEFKIQANRHLVCNMPDITITEKKKMWLLQLQPTIMGNIQNNKTTKTFPFPDACGKSHLFWKARRMGPIKAEGRGSYREGVLEKIQHISDK